MQIDNFMERLLLALQSGLMDYVSERTCVRKHVRMNSWAEFTLNFNNFW